MNHQRKIIYERRRIMLAGDFNEIENFLNSLTIDYPELPEVVMAEENAELNEFVAEIIFE